ncbi:Na+/H+ antiporter NhaA [Agaribacterium haliotis]|uniref:Na+/H+ antiporter NhaA n=1 Tax=Agaribacterium haliotis TaxID=2013869 RepID=UPI000BB59F21|nr:Na+/H+ antiporter NhaA [Agaribacterium haliotis]
MNLIKRYVHHQLAGPVLLFSATFLALLFANAPLLKPYYKLLLDTPVVVQVGALEIAKPLLLWVNDGLMAFFFLLVGLELKREFLDGELSDKRNIILPGLGAIGGMAAPALIYVLINKDSESALSGWAIPAATDIAFALGVLALLGSRVPLSLKVFLTSLAIFDDVGAIIIIAMFYTANISTEALIIAGVCTGILLVLNRTGVAKLGPYTAVGLVMWVALLKSGVHATLAGVLIAMFIPMRDSDNPERSPLKALEHDLHSTVFLITLPVFAFCNAGINFAKVGIDQVMHGVPLGIALGLFFGKQIGVLLFCMLPVLFGWIKLPQGMSKMSLWGASALCGIGFTMSLFIGSLAFQETGINMVFDERLGILMGSLASGVLGFIILHRCLPKAEPGAEKTQAAASH